MTSGDLLIRWTARLAMAGYFLALVGMLASNPKLGRFRRQRWAWTLGCLAFLLHLAAAFHFEHHWSHGAAYNHIAHRTAAVVGWSFGGGIYVNYFFALVWVGDVAWWWCRPDGYVCRPRWLNWTMHGFMLFIAVNATVVFGEGAIRWWGVAGLLVLAGVWLWRWFAASHEDTRCRERPPWHSAEPGDQ